MSPTSSQTLYTVHLIFHSAQNLPVADLATFSCDPYIHATINVPSFKDQSPREPADPPLEWRTPTVHRTRNPTWDAHWLVAAVPADGFQLEVRVRDEDQKKDDRLGKAVVLFGRELMHEGFEVREKAYKVKKRRGSFRPWLQTYLAAAFPGQKLLKHNRVVISARIVGETKNADGRKPFTIGPNAYTEHFSPLLGHFVHHGDKLIKSLPPNSSPNPSDASEKQRRISASSFSAVKLQLSGPAPPEFHCHYVGYNTFIKWLYSNSGVMGHLLNHGLRKQYRTIYSYDKNTKYGVIDAQDFQGSTASEERKSCTDLHMFEGSSTEPNVALARTFLSLLRFDAGVCLYTYVLTLDAEWRFSETGDEFAIDFLSKHMMHADGAPVVMISGEFFVRKIAEFERSEERKENATGVSEAEGSVERPPDVKRKSSRKMKKGGKASESTQAETKCDTGSPDPSSTENIDMDPSHYELIIDNNSGTYRPSKDLLPAFQAWLGAPHRLGALGRVTAMDAFDDNLKRMKEERKEEKKRLAGGKLPRKVGVRRGSSVSSFEGASSLSSGEVDDMLEEAEKRNNEELGKEKNHDDAQKKHDDTNEDEEINVGHD